MFWLVQLLVPISVVVVLPVLGVWLICRTVANRDNQKAKIVIKAIECNSTIDADKIAEALTRKERTPEEILQLRLLRGCMFAFVGVVIGIFAGIIWALTYDDCSPDGALLFGLLSGISLAIGGAYLVVYYVTRKSLTGNRQIEN